jgi:predicted nucleotide-binding protein
MTKSLDQLLRDLQDMKAAREKLASFAPEGVKTQYGDANLIKLNAHLSATFDRVFDGRVQDKRRFSRARELHSGPLVIGGIELHEVIEAVIASKETAIALWDAAIEQWEIEISRANTSLVEDIDEPISLRKVFVVHGRNHGARDQVAHVLSRLDFEAVILDQIASGTKTVIEKFEATSDVPFAIVLLTSDDLGRAKTSESDEPRARQNVYFELGYFVAKLSRERVVAFKEPDVIVPSDLGGVVIEEFDNRGAWKHRLVKELRNAGFEADANKLL